MSIIPGRAPETSRLIEHLSDLAVGTFFEYEELSALIHKDVTSSQTGGGRSNLSSAIRFLRREKRQVWGAVRGKGIRRLSDEEALDEAVRYQKGAGRKSRVAETIVTCADYEELPAELKAKHQAILMSARMSRLFSTGRGIDKVGRVLGKEPKPALPDPGDFMKAFRGGTA